MSGAWKESIPVNAVQSAPMMAEFSHIIESKKIDVKLVHAQNITRPQLKFVEKVDNSATPFVPKITKKPNAIVLLPDCFTGNNLPLNRQVESPVAISQPIVKGVLTSVLLANTKESHVLTLAPSSIHARARAHGSLVHMTRHYPHPYEYEIKHLQYPERQLEPTTPIMYLPFESTPYEWIDTEAGLVALSAYLDTVTEMAVDLENHNYRSYQGFCCLMQISTRDKDFLIDAIQLRHQLHMLNHSFTNPNILKVSPLHASVTLILTLCLYSRCRRRYLGISWCRVRCTMATARFWPLSSQFI